MTEQRQKEGNFTSLADFCRRMLPCGLNKQALDSLIRCGALDGLGLNRRQMIEFQEQVLADCRDERNSIVTGQMNLFGGADERAVQETQIPPLAEYDRAFLLQLEHDSLGLYLSGHPLEQVEWLRRLCHAADAAALREQKDGATVLLIVTLQHIKQHTTKQGETMCFLTCEDRSGTADCVVFPSLYPAVRQYLQKEAVLCIRGKLTQKEETVSVLCDSVLTEEGFRRTMSHGKAPRTCGAGAAVSGRCAGLLLSDRPEKDALSAWRTGDGGAAGIVCCTLRAGSAGTDRVPAGKIDIFIFCAELLKFCMELVNFFEYHLTTREISV